MLLDDPPRQSSPPAEPGPPAELPPAGRAGAGGRRRLRPAALALVLVLLGGVIALGARRGATTADNRARLAATLRVQVGERSVALAGAEDRVGQLRSVVEATRNQRRRADRDHARAAVDVAALGPVAGSVAATGPGVRIKVTDRLAGGSGSANPRVSASGTPRPHQSAPTAVPGAAGTGRIQDHDLADLVNVLWISGAEAVAINGVRLTALSAIRAAGDLVLINFVPVLAPYDVEAIGDPRRLVRRVEQSAVVDRLRHRPGSPVTSLTASAAETLTLPAAPLPVLRHARRSGS
ncbi:DUF881 domain-containing protein [Frankia gtarii]|uniref:DUF881 domain-containing protein n=1 Tax=Frankia gtarii TaxID=2950102 RepID=UPI0021BFC48A|nr:DUF881 domain-containing protein [Frankia gtarii]